MPLWLILFLLGILLWWVLAAALANGYGAPVGNRCGSCTGLDQWYKSLSLGKKVLQAPYYVAKKAHCALIKCPT